MVLNRWDRSICVSCYDHITIHAQMHANSINTVTSEIYARQSRLGKKPPAQGFIGFPNLHGSCTGTLGKYNQLKNIKNKYCWSRTKPHQKTKAYECRKPTKRRSKVICPQDIQLPIVTDPYPQLQGIGRGGAGIQQGDAGI